MAEVRSAGDLRAGMEAKRFGGDPFLLTSDCKQTRPGSWTARTPSGIRLQLGYGSEGELHTNIELVTAPYGTVLYQAEGGAFPGADGAGAEPATIDHLTDEELRENKIRSDEILREVGAKEATR